MSKMSLERSRLKVPKDNAMFEGETLSPLSQTLILDFAHDYE